MESQRSNKLSTDDFSFFHELRVRWAEVDPQGIVFNPNYFIYADVAVTEYMRRLGFVYPEGFERLGTDLFAVNATADFHASAKFDDLLRLGTRVAHIGNTSFQFQVGVFRADELLVTVALTYVNATRNEKKPAPVPAAFVDKIVAFEKKSPARK